MATLIFFFMMSEATPYRRRRSTGRNCFSTRRTRRGTERTQRYERDRDRTDRAGGERSDRGGEAAAEGAVRHALGGVPSPGGDPLAGRVALLRREAVSGRRQGALRSGRHPGPGRA